MATGRKWIGFAIAGLAILLVAIFYISNGCWPDAKRAAPDKASATEWISTSGSTDGTVQIVRIESVKEPVAAAIMPLNAQTLEKFQEANGRLTQDASDPVSAALGIREAIKELGHDPDRTLHYWISPDFQRDVAVGDSKNVVDTMRTIANLVSVALGDGASEIDFETILTNCSPELQSAARKRRTSRVSNFR